LNRCHADGIGESGLLTLRPRGWLREPGFGPSAPPLTSGTPLGIARQGSNEANRIVPWNFTNCVALVYMQKLEQIDLMLGSVVLGVLVVVIINGIVWNIV
jgi:hypothetical protein